jgi:hypothetical protein
MYDPNETCAICGELLSGSPIRRYHLGCGCSRNIYITRLPKVITRT